tara:strand:- start:60 stop:605 length:546 start_codon:yes stop_codon:yes gene_type:complete
MKTLIISIVLTTSAALTSIQTYAQKCKFAYEKEDPISGKSTRGIAAPIKLPPIGGYEYWMIGFNQVDDSYYLDMTIRLYGELNNGLNKNDSVMFKLANDELITCYVQDNVAPQTNAVAVSGSLIVTTTYQAKYTLTKEQLIKLSESNLVFARMNISEKVYENAPKEKHQKKILRAAICILK